MHLLPLLCTCFFVLLVAAEKAFSHTNSSGIFNCTGGTLYFAAHPADTLLYQNPDLFHDLYVFKCVTTVLFTSGDRGITGNHSRSLEQGVEAAYAWMSGLATDNQTWRVDTVRIGNGSVSLSRHPEAANLHIVYLRLPDGGPRGSGYEVDEQESLRKLWNGEIETITTTSGNATYTLDSLKDIAAALLRENKAREVRVLDHKTGIPDDEGEREDHADHVVSAKLVVDVVKEEQSTAKLQGYAAGFARKFDANLNETDLDFKRKVTALLTYAEYDQHMCKTYDECLNNLDDGLQKTVFPDSDVLWAADALSREYYVS